MLGKFIYTKKEIIKDFVTHDSKGENEERELKISRLFKLKPQVCIVKKTSRKDDLRRRIRLIPIRLNTIRHITRHKAFIANLIKR